MLSFPVEGGNSCIRSDGSFFKPSLHAIVKTFIESFLHQ